MPARVPSAAAASPRAVRPIVLALAPPAPGGAPGSRIPALTVLGGSRLIQRLLSTLGRLGLPAPVLAAPPSAAADLRAVLGGSVEVIGADGDRREVLTAVMAHVEEPAVLIHDAERALTPASVISEVISCADEGVDAVVPVMPMTDSVKEVRPEGLHNIDRSALASLQSPRLMRRETLVRALASERSEGSDEVLAALADGARIRTVQGSHAGFPVIDRLSLWQAQISLGLARDTSHRHGLARS